MTKVDRAEAYRPLAILATAFWSLVSLLAAAAMALFVFTVLRGPTPAAACGRPPSSPSDSAVHARRDHWPGRDGRGLPGPPRDAAPSDRRQAARPEKTNEKTIARFEREVQLTSQLTHPNTVTVYDFGRTPEGIFYYAMEFLDGIDLQALVARHGPQPEGRVIHILRRCAGRWLRLTESG